ncbi:MAG: 1-acyl-sn-glycerol-3-phosphate acyltransferase [Myxococcales bacterium]|nr:1-acyl-sn-glycerol-3-phosphate acyltransferase [Myxococcales bacterium]
MTALPPPHSSDSGSKSEQPKEFGVHSGGAGSRRVSQLNIPQIDPRTPRPTPERLVAATLPEPVSDGLSEAELAHVSRMTTRFGLLARWLAGIFFGPVRFPPEIDTEIATCAKEGVPVYVMKTVSLLDTLFFNFAFVRARLPLAEFTNGPALTAFQPWRMALKLWWRRRWSKAQRRPDGEIVTGLLRRRRSVLLFLRRGFSFTQLGASAPTDPHLSNLIITQRQVTFPLFIVPQVLVWERNPSGDGTNILETFFGDPEAPGTLRKFGSFIFNHRRAFVRLGEPINVAEFLLEHENASDTGLLAERLRLVIQQRFASEDRVIRGSRVKPPRELADEILADPRFESRLQAAAGADDDRSLDDLKREASANLIEIAADLRMWMIDIFSLILTLVWARIYTGLEVDAEGLERIRQAGKRGPIVIAPSHKSHIDYLVISYIFYRNGMVPPHIAAGANLSFFPVGWCFRHAGAFFLRRTFRGQPIYGAAFEAYVTKLLKDDHWLEFFIEGTRSRTGKLLPPRYGILRMILQSVADGVVPDVMIAPTNFGYERMIEEAAYRRELEGGEKKREGVGDLLGATRVLVHKYGRMRVQFAEPLSVRALLEQEGVTPGAGYKAEDFSRAVKVCGYHILGGINQAAVLTPTALTAAVLLTKINRGISRTDLLTRVGHLLDTAVRRGAVLAGPLGTAMRMQRQKLAFAETQDRVAQRQSGGAIDPLGAQSQRARALGQAVEPFLNGALEMFEESGWMFRKTFDDDDEVFIVKRDGRLHLDYYKNNLIHIFVPDALLAASLIAGMDNEGRVDPDSLSDDTKLLSRLLKYEFVYEPAVTFEVQYQRSVATFMDNGWLRTRPDGGMQLSARLRPLVQLYAKLIQNFIESYLVLGRALPALGEAPMTDKAFVAHCQAIADKRYELGEVQCREAISHVNLSNALKIYIEEGYVAQRTEISGKRTVKMLRVDTGENTASQFAFFVSKIESFHKPWVVGTS